MRGTYLVGSMVGSSFPVAAKGMQNCQIYRTVLSHFWLTPVLSPFRFLWICQFTTAMHGKRPNIFVYDQFSCNAPNQLSNKFIDDNWYRKMISLHAIMHEKKKSASNMPVSIVCFRLASRFKPDWTDDCLYVRDFFSIDITTPSHVFHQWLLLDKRKQKNWIEKLDWKIVQYWERTTNSHFTREKLESQTVPKIKELGRRGYQATLPLTLSPFALDPSHL